MPTVKLLKWFLDVLENDGHDIREVKGKIRMAITLLETNEYAFGRDDLFHAMIGTKEVEEDA